jgi:hypothetical protein
MSPRFTSVVLRHLHEAHVTEWNEYLGIPVEVMNDAAMFIVRQFNRATSRFEETSDAIYDRNLGVRDHL